MIGPEAKTSAAAQYRDAPHISRSFIVFDARTGIAAKYASSADLPLAAGGGKQPSKLANTTHFSHHG